MRPYYEREGIILYHGDCLNVTVPCDLIVTDPPYGQQFVSGRRSKSWGYIIGDDDVSGTMQRLNWVLTSLKPHRHVYIFAGKHLPLHELPLASPVEIVWDKGILGMGDLTLPWSTSHEAICFAVYVPSKANRNSGYGKLSARLRRGSIVRESRANSIAVKYHPTEKPVGILRQFIESSSVFGETVYDPFAGSGSTLIAAALEGRTGVGCEIEERYCEIAARRIEQELGRDRSDPQTLGGYDLIG